MPGIDSVSMPVARDTQGALGERLLDEAADWLVRLHGGELSPAERADFERWRQSSPAHHQAWARAEALMGKLGGLPASLALPALDRPTRHARSQRRAVVAKLAALLAVAPAGWLGWRTAQQQGWTADVRTATGEQRHLTLADGSRLLLDTGTAVDIVFDSTQRLVYLRKGAISVETAADPGGAQRPFAVHTALGRLRALGTRFTVRVADAAVHLAVTEGAVEVTPRQGVPLVVPAGQQTVLTEQGTEALQPVSVAQQAWVQGMLVADALPLGEVCAALSRYRAGILQCAPEVAQLRVSGAYPLTDTERALAMLESTYPVQVARRWHGHWVTLLAR